MAEETAATACVTEHPLMFTFRDAISGRGFLAGITLSGKGLMVLEDGRWWLYGVRPGAIAESGDTPQETFWKFRNRYKEVLFDIAEAAASFEAFRREVEAFFNQPDMEEEERWEKALALVRAGQTIPAPFSALARQSPEDRPSQMAVQRLDGENQRFMPTDNVRDAYAYSTEAA